MRRPPRGLTPEEAALWAQLAATVTPLRPPARGGPRQPVGPALAPAPGGAAPERLAPQAPPRRSATGTRPPLLPVLPDRIAASPKPRPHSPPVPRSPPLGSAAVPPAFGDPGAPGAHWERRLAKAALAPELTLDLHGHTLGQAHARLNEGLAQARAMGVRLVLVITGRPRPAEAADRGERRGAIRAKFLDWLAAGPHAGAIAAVRPAHPRHGGEGALYLVLRRKG